jgi:hypothetical protein
MAQRATGHASTAQVMPGPSRSTGRTPSSSTRLAAATGGRRQSGWAHRADVAGRIGVWGIPILAFLAVLGLATTNAFAKNPIVYANFLATKWSSPMALAVTTATVVFALVSIVGLTLLLLGGRAKWLAVAGAGPGIVGALMMLGGVGSVIVQTQGSAKAIWHGQWSDFAATAQARGTHAAWLVVGGAVLLVIGWILLGLAVMRTRGLNRGDGALLAISAPLVYLGGFVLHLLPALGGFLLGAAGLGIVFTSGRVAREATAPAIGPVRSARVPAGVPSAFARFTDDEPVASASAAADVLVADEPVADDPIAGELVAGHLVSAGYAPDSDGASEDDAAVLAGLVRSYPRVGASGNGRVSAGRPSVASANGGPSKIIDTNSRDGLRGVINPPSKSRWNGVWNRSQHRSMPAAHPGQPANRGADTNAGGADGAASNASNGTGTPKPAQPVNVSRADDRSRSNGSGSGSAAGTANGGGKPSGSTKASGGGKPGGSTKASGGGKPGGSTKASGGGKPGGGGKERPPAC